MTTVEKTRITSHRDLVVWQKAMDLVTGVYEASKVFPRDEVYGLTNQMRRAAVSVPANVAEGQGRRSKKEFVNFLENARGSLLELDTHLDLAWRLGYLELAKYSMLREQVEEVGRVLNGLLRALCANL